MSSNEHDSVDAEDSTLADDTDGVSGDSSDAIASENFEPILPDGDDDYDDGDDPDDRGASLSSRILTWLVLLLIGAGLALWGGPKLAPNLPGWAAPLARVLTPGGDAAQQEVAALRTDVAARFDALPPPPDDARITELARAAAGDATQDLTARVDQLAADMPADISGDLDGRLTTLETRFAGIDAEVTALNDTLSQAISSGGDMSAEALAQLAAKDAVIEGLRAEVDELATRLGALSQRIEAVDAASQERIDAAAQEAQSAEQAAADLAHQTALQDRHTALSLAATAGRNYVAELVEFEELAQASATDTVRANAASGLPSIGALKDEFAAASHLAIRASIASEAGDGTLSRVSAFFQSQVATRSLEPQDGDGTDAVLSRIGAALNLGDLATVLGESEALSDPARAPLDPWLDRVRLRHAVLSDIDAMAVQPS